jgi:hypothetical protein
MASTSEVRDYFTYWLQLDKGLILDGIRVKPMAVVAMDGVNGNRLSGDFEAMWERALRSPREAYLEGTEISLAELLTGQWEMVLCPRCPMPMPMRVGAFTDTACPCHEMPMYPNTETIMPHLPVSTPDRLGMLRDRLKN